MPICGHSGHHPLQLNKLPFAPVAVCSSVLYSARVESFDRLIKLHTGMFVSIRSPEHILFHAANLLYLYSSPVDMPNFLSWFLYALKGTRFKTSFRCYSTEAPFGVVRSWAFCCRESRGGTSVSPGCHHSSPAISTSTRASLRATKVQVCGAGWQNVIASIAVWNVARNYRGQIYAYHRCPESRSSRVD